MRKTLLIIVLNSFSLLTLSSAAQLPGGSAAESAGDPLWDHILLLEHMISLWPKQEYYLQLADLYGRAGDSRRQLEVYEIAYGMGWLDRTSQFVRMAQLMLRAGRLREADEALSRALDADVAENAERP